MATIIELSGGAWIFLAIVVGWSLFTLLTLYTRRGSGINQRPWRSPYLGQNGAHAPSVLDHDRVASRNLTRGTRA